MLDALAGRSLRRPTRELIAVGHGLIAGVISQIGPGFTLVTQDAPLAAVGPRAVVGARETFLAASLERSDLEALAARTSGDGTIVGVGGGVVMDTAKWIAWRTGAPLILAPTVLSVDAGVTNTVAVRDSGRICYEGFVEAEQIVLDLDVVRAAPARLNRAGAGDLLSIHTALWDWRVGQGRGGSAFEPDVAGQAAAVLRSLEEVAAGLATVTDEALATVLTGYAIINDLAVRLGHAQMEEGSEHYLAYCLESRLGISFVHGEVVTLGMVLMSRLQGNQPDWAREIADQTGVRWRPADLGISHGQLRGALTDLAGYTRRAGLPHSVVNEAVIDDSVADFLLAGLD